MAKGEISQIMEKLAQAESIVEDLRQQLDAAVGAEEMIEELPDNNFALNELIDSLKVMVEDLDHCMGSEDGSFNHALGSWKIMEEMPFNVVAGDGISVNWWKLTNGTQCSNFKE